MATPHGFEDKVAFIWRVADKLRGHFKQHEYGSVMLPLLVLRRLDAVLTDTKPEVVALAKTFTHLGRGQDQRLREVSGFPFYNVSPLTMTTVLSDADNVADGLLAYVDGLSPSAAEVMEAFGLPQRVRRMDKAGILYAVLGDFVDLDVRPSQVGDEAMGYIFEELLRKFSEMSNETAGEHYTPREVIRLMVDLLLTGPDTDDITSAEKPVRSVYDPAAGTGGMLFEAVDHIAGPQGVNTEAIVNVYGQELNPETWAIARSDLMIRGLDPSRMALGNTFTEDAYPHRTFDYLLANPPYGVDWKAYADDVKDEADLGERGRFSAGLPRVSDGSLLFVQHMVARMAPPTEDGNGARLGVVLSGSPLFSGAAGSGESNIRRWILENDLLEGIVALPDQMFYNTGISTYVWILTNAKTEGRGGTVTLVDARALGTKMRKSLGDKRKELTGEAIAEVVRLYDERPADARVKILHREELGFQRVTVERPLRRRYEITADTLAVLGEDVRETYAGLVGGTWATEKELRNAINGLPGPKASKDMTALRKAAAMHDPDAEPVVGKNGVEPDPDLRDAENVPLPAGWFALSEDEQVEVLHASAEAHLEAEVRPYVPDAWIDHAKTKVGFEIPFTRQFYVYEPPRPVEVIAKEIKDLESEIQGLVNGLGL